MSISVQMNSSPREIRDLIGPLASKKGPLNIYCWYEGKDGLPRSGAIFYKESLFEPLLKQKSDVLFNLYSLIDRTENTRFVTPEELPFYLPLSNSNVKEEIVVCL